MKIDSPNVSKLGATRRNAKKGGISDSGSFGDFIESATTEGGVAQTGSKAVFDIPSVLLNLQEMPQKQSITREIVEHGNKVLFHLDEIRLALLNGEYSADQLEQLRRLLKNERANAEDAQLAALIEEIEIRAEVEIAKYETAQLKIKGKIK